MPHGARGDSGCLDTTKLTASLLLSGPLPSVLVEVVNRGDSGYLDTTKLTFTLLLSGPLPSVVAAGRDPG
jgi:hypothetical protein